MRLYQSLHAAHLVLQPLARALERVIEGEIGILETFVEMRRAFDDDLPLVGKNQTDAELVEAAV